MIEMEAVPNMNPGIRPGQLPPFHELDEYTFQYLCRDLFDAEPSVATCEIYGTRGQAQHGIDLLAHRADGDGIEVGQCKCYENFNPRPIERVREEFFEHYGSRWRQQNVKRFILFVAGDVSSTQHQDKILEERDLFAAFGIRYEVWSAAQIRNKLRLRPDIVSTYLQPAEHWVRVICGTSLPAAYPAPAMQPQMAAVVNAALVERLERRESEDAERRLEDMRGAWREGRQREAVALLDELKADTATWETISPETRAKLLRFEAGARLHLSGDVDLAKRLADEAHTLAPSDDEVRVRALIARAEAGSGVAAELLAGRRDADSMNLRASLLLEQGNVEGFRQALEALPEEHHEPSAETARLRALLHLLDKEIDRARLEAQKALELEPRWESVRFTAGVVDYMSALSAIALPNYLVGWPEPVDWTLIKRDDESRARLRSAAEVFRELSEGVDDEDDRQRYETWVLACLANDPEAQEEAVSYCGRLLGADPAHHRAILWAVARSFDVDLAPSETRLRDMVDDDSAEIPHVLALSTILMADRRYGEAADLLERTRSVFEAGDAVLLWTSWHAQALALGDDPRGALQELDASEASEEMRRIRTVVLAVQAEDSGDWDTVVEHLERSYEATRDPAFLLDACELKDRQEDWAYVADRAERLVEELGTAEALRLGALGAHNDRRFELCLRLLDGHRDLLPGGKLPRELRRMRLSCQHSLGFLSEAETDAEEIAREDPTVPNLLTLLQVRLDSGNRPGMVLTARQLAEHLDLDNEQALGIAQVVWLDDLNLAISLWRRAVRQNLPDNRVSLALNMGFRLGLDRDGLDRDLQSLTQRAIELALRGEGGLRAINLQDTVEVVEQQHERSEVFQRMYLDGIAPIHFAAEFVGGSLAHAYHRRLLENEAQGALAKAPFLLIEHGGRGYPEGSAEPLAGRRLVLDVTAVLLAEHLGILDKVEQTFGRLRMPHELLRALMRMRDRAYPHQPSRQQTLGHVVRLANEGALKAEDLALPPAYENALLVEEMGERWAAALERARSLGGYVVDSLPLTKKADLRDPPTALPEGAEGHIVNPRGVLDALRMYEPLSAVRATEIAEVLGEEGREHPDRPAPEPGSYLFLDGGMAEILAAAGFLEIACERFEVHVGAEELLSARADLRAYEQGIETEQWLTGLIDRLRRGLEQGKYGIVVAAASSPEDAAMDSDDPSVLCLDTILRFEPQEGDTIWIDDRAVNKYQRWKGAPTASVHDILRALLASGSMREDEYHRALARLRASNARFPRVEKEEILYHLRQANIENGVVVETRELATLRRYVAVCLLGGEILQRPTVTDGNVLVDAGEMPLLMQVDRAVAEALMGLWEGEEEEASKIARAEWLLANMHLGYTGLTNVVALPGSDEDEQPKVASDLKGLTVRAVAFPSEGVAPSARSQRIEWLENRVLKKRFDSDPGLLTMSANEVKDAILEVRQGLLGQEPEPVISMALQPLYEDLPGSLHDELSRDPGFMAAVGLKVVLVLQVGPYRFLSDRFWNAAKEAVNGHLATIDTMEEDTKTITLRATGDPSVLRLTGPADGNDPTVSNEFFPLLLESPAAREDFLRRNRRWFDCPNERFEHAVAEIAALTDPHGRIDEAERWRDSSVAVFYENLREKMVGQDQIYYSELLPPRAERLLEHLRLESAPELDRPFRETAERAARRLIREAGLQAALERIGGLPISVPAPLLETMEELPASEQRALIKRLIRLDGSPISKVQLIRVLVHLSESGAYLRLARRVASSLLDEGGAEEWEAFSVVLRWVNDEFDFRLDMRALSSRLRLAMVWYHAHRLFAVLASTGLPYGRTRTVLDQPDKRLTSEVFERDSEYWLDVCHPRRVDRVVFLHMGLAYAFGTETDHVDGAALQRMGGDNQNLLLLRDPALARDGLGSFLGGDRGEALSRLMDQEEADAITSSSLRERLSEAIEHLSEEHHRGAAWGLLFYVLGDQPPPDNLRDSLKEAISNTAIADLVRSDTPTGLAALRTASLQAANLDDEDWRSRLKDELVTSARYVAEQKRREGTVEIDVRKLEEQTELRSLIESAVHISAAVEGGRAFADFADLLTRLTDVWPAAVPFCKLVVLRLCEELEPQKAKPFWRVLVRLRGQ